MSGAVPIRSQEKPRAKKGASPGHGWSHLLVEIASSTTQRECSHSSTSVRAQLEEASARIQRLEQDLERHRDLLNRALQSMASIQASPGWRIFDQCSRLRERWLPKGTRRGTMLARFLKKSGNLLSRLTSTVGHDNRRSINDGYRRWIACNEPVPQELKQQRQVGFAKAPKFTFIVHLSRAERRHLRALSSSILAQTYANWELILLERDSSNARTAAMVRSLTHQDPRVHVESGNNLLSAASGEYVAWIGELDTLAPFALFELLQAIQRHTDVDLIYSDEDCIGGWRGRRDPVFKPDWSPDALRSHNYIGQLVVFSRHLLGRIGEIDSSANRLPSYDLVLRATEIAHGIVHIPKILYHRREEKRKGSQKPRPEPASDLQALVDHLDRSGLRGEVQAGLIESTFQVRYELSSWPLVSIIIANRDQPHLLKRCIESARRSAYHNWEIIVVENNSQLPATFDYYAQLARQSNTRVLTWDKAFNYSAINNFAVRHALGSVLLFLNNDIEVINDDWLERMLEHALRQPVGVVGAKLCYANDTIQHAGVVLGIQGGPAHYHWLFPRHAPGYAKRLVTVQNLSAVTGACLMTRRQVFGEVGGFDEAFAVAFNDIDYCLKTRSLGYLTVWTPHAELYHHEFATRGGNDSAGKIALNYYEQSLFQHKWSKQLQEGDAYYSPNLTVDRLDCSLRAA
jgi:GT2 family glycosyltransferase